MKRSSQKVYVNFFYVDELSTSFMNRKRTNCEVNSSKTVYPITSYWKMEWSRGMKKRKKKCCFICKSPMPGSGGLINNNIIPLHKVLKS